MIRTAVERDLLRRLAQGAVVTVYLPRRHGGFERLIVARTPSGPNDRLAEALDAGADLYITEATRG